VTSWNYRLKHLVELELQLLCSMKTVQNGLSKWCLESINIPATSEIIYSRERGDTRCSEVACTEWDMRGLMTYSSIFSSVCVLFAQRENNLLLCGSLSFWKCIGLALRVFYISILSFFTWGVGGVVLIRDNIWGKNHSFKRFSFTIFY